jgi:hypothetical protein
MPPRFEACHAAVLKSTMLTRLPECVFTPGDYEALTKETGLSKQQIAHWAEHIRYRYASMEEREDFLRSDAAPTKEKVMLHNIFIVMISCN